MKRILIIIVALCSLTSCKTLTAYREPEEVIIISSVAFSKEKESYIFTVQSEEEKNNLYSTSADSFSKAIEKLNRDMYSRLLYSHCAVIIIDSELSIQSIKEIIKLSLDIFPLNARIILSHDSNNLLKSNKPIGFELLRYLQEKEDTNKLIKSTLYKVANQKDIITLPIIEEIDGGFTSKVIKVE